MKYAGFFPAAGISVLGVGALTVVGCGMYASKNKVPALLNNVPQEHLQAALSKLSAQGFDIFLKGAGIGTVGGASMGIAMLGLLGTAISYSPHKCQIPLFSLLLVSSALVVGYGVYKMSEGVTDMVEAHNRTSNLNIPTF